jgi:hypothetical protein
MVFCVIVQIARLGAAVHFLAGRRSVTVENGGRVPEPKVWLVAKETVTRTEEISL